MKNSIEIRQERATAIENADTLLTLAKNEARDFTTDEQVSYDGMMTNIDKLAKDIEVVGRQEKLNAEAASIPVSFETQNTSDSKEIRGFSFIDAVNAAKSGRIEGRIKEMDEEARRENPGQDFKGVGVPRAALESRAANDVLTGTSNPVNVKAFTDLMVDASVLIPAGANFYTGVAANQKLPIIDSIAVGFQTESTSVSATVDGTVSNKMLAPSTCIAATNISNQALQQNASLEAAFRRSMAAAIMSELEKEMLAATGTLVLDSIFKSAYVGTAAGPTTWTNSTAVAAVQSMQSELIELGNDINRGNIKLLLNGNAYSDLMTEVATQDGSGFAAGSANLIDRTVMNIPYFVSNNVGNGTNDTRARALMLDISKCHIALFGGLDLLVDPYSQSLLGGTRLVMSSLLDGQLAGSAGKEVAVNCIAAA